MHEDCLNAAYTFSNGMIKQFSKANLTYPTGCLLKGNPGSQIVHWNVEGRSRNLDVKAICLKMGKYIFYIPCSLIVFAYDMSVQLFFELFLVIFLYHRSKKFLSFGIWKGV